MSSLPESTEPVRHERPSFSFAKRNGATVVDWEGTTARVAYREGASPQALVELKRFLGGASLSMQAYPPAEFDQLLQRL